MPAPRKVALTDTAVGDLDRLDTFLRLINPAAADRIQDAFLATAQRLVAYPQAGRPWLWSPPEAEIREVFVPFERRGYVMRYEIRDELILILRFHHALEDRDES